MDDTVDFDRWFKMLMWPENLAVCLMANCNPQDRAGVHNVDKPGHFSDIHIKTEREREIKYKIPEFI